MLDIKSLINRPTMRSTRFFVKGSLPTLNEYTLASRGNKFASATMKRNAEAHIKQYILTQLRGWKTDAPVFVVFRWVEKNKRRDHDNVAFAKKFVLDALVDMGTIQGDGWKHVEGFADLFSIDKNDPGVEVIILEVGDEQ